LSEGGQMKGALTRFRVMAYVVGVFLLLLCVAMVLKYAADMGQFMKVVGPIHGFLYAIYLVISVDLALKLRWSIKGTALVLLAGTVPFLSFWAERKVVEKTAQGVPL
jgi:integral membrane protein